MPQVILTMQFVQLCTLDLLCFHRPVGRRSATGELALPSPPRLIRHLGLFNSIHLILRDPGAVSRAGRKGPTKVSNYGRKSPWVPTLTGLFPNGQANAGSRLGTKNALYYCAQSANSFS